MSSELNTLGLADIIAKTGKLILILALDKEEKSMLWMSSKDITEAMIPMIQYVTVDLLAECKHKPTDAKVNDLVIITIKPGHEIRTMLSLFNQNKTPRLNKIMIDKLDNLSYFGVLNSKPYMLAIADLLLRINLSSRTGKHGYIRWGEGKIIYSSPMIMRKEAKMDEKKFKGLELLRRLMLFWVSEPPKPLQQSEIKLVVEVAGKLLPPVRNHLVSEMGRSTRYSQILPLIRHQPPGLVKLYKELCEQEQLAAVQGTVPEYCLLDIAHIISMNIRSHAGALAKLKQMCPYLAELDLKDAVIEGLAVTLAVYRPDGSDLLAEAVSRTISPIVSISITNHDKFEELAQNYIAIIRQHHPLMQVVTRGSSYLLRWDGATRVVIDNSAIQQIMQRPLAPWRAYYNGRFILTATCARSLISRRVDDLYANDSIETIVLLLHICKHMMIKIKFRAEIETLLEQMPQPECKAHGQGLGKLLDEYTYVIGPRRREKIYEQIKQIVDPNRENEAERRKMKDEGESEKPDQGEAES